MTTLIIPDDYDDAESTRLDICIGEDIDYQSSREDAVVEFAAFTHEGKSTSMCPFGFTLDIHEATALRDLLNTAITKVKGTQGQLKLELITTEPNEYGEGAGVELINRSDNDTTLFSVFEGEPEDMTMGRDLSDCLNVDTLVQLGFEAGCAGLDLCIKYTDEGGEDA